MSKDAELAKAITDGNIKKTMDMLLQDSSLGINYQFTMDNLGVILME